MSNTPEAPTPTTSVTEPELVNSAFVVRDRHALAAWWQQIPDGAVAWSDDTRDLTCVTWQGYPLLLAGPNADPAPYLRFSARPVMPGGAMLLLPNDAAALPTLADAFANLGILREQIEHRQFPWGTHTLRVPLPVAADEGYTLLFITQQPRSRAAWLADFRAGPDLLEAALADLTDAQLDLQPPNRLSDREWSIRQLTHHILDLDLTGLFSHIHAFAEPGRTLISPGFDQDVMADGLDNTHRPVAPTIALFRAQRAWTLSLIDHLPDALDRTTVGSDGTPMPAEWMLQMQTAHALGHIVDIHDIRTAHGLPAANRPDQPARPT